MLDVQKKQQKTLVNLQQKMDVNSVLNDLERLKKMKDDGILSEDEFNALKQKSLASAVVEGTDDSDFAFQVKTDDSVIRYNEEMRMEGDEIHFFISFSDGVGGDIWGNKLNAGVAIENEEGCLL